MQKKAYALVGAAAAVAAAVGPLIGGFITTYFSWRVGFLMEAVIIAIILLNIRLVKDVPYTGPRHLDLVGSVLSVFGMGGIVLSILVWQEGGESVAVLMSIGVVGMLLFAWWLRRGKKQGKSTLIDPDLFKSKYFRLGITEQMLQNIALGGLMIGCPSTSRWYSNIPPCKPAWRSHPSRSACLPWQSWQVVGRASAARPG